MHAWNLLRTAAVKGPKEDDETFILYVSIAAFLVLFAGLMSGLTLGLLSLTNVELEVSPCPSNQIIASALSFPVSNKLREQVLRRSGTPKEQMLATKIQPVRAQSKSCN